MKVWIPHAEGVELLGPVPPGVQIEVYAGGDDLPGDPSGVEFWVPPFLSGEAATGALDRLPDVRVVQLMSAGADVWVGRVPDSVTLCDGRGVHNTSTSEWVVTAILASVRSFVRFAQAQAERRWDKAETDELSGKRVLVLGAGAIGGAVRDRLLPFEVEVVMVARTARDGVHGVDELHRLLPQADVVVVLLPLTDATRGFVDAAFLARMPDGALLVNAARGPVADTDAIVAELAAGRLRAALDVTDPEPLPPEHPLWTVPGLLLTPHVAGSVHGLLPRAYRLVREQLRRYVAGEPLDNVVSDGY